ncbi:hypothetical protein [Nocardia africana]|uniref:Uncharacterized protein n=1 Tax=Nocardia africana TaxID=134964 RepID=A0ABW6NEF5_9NOCA
MDRDEGGIGLGIAHRIDPRIDDGGRTLTMTPDIAPRPAASAMENQLALNDFATVMSRGPVIGTVVGTVLGALVGAAVGASTCLVVGPGCLATIPADVLAFAGAGGVIVRRRCGGSHRGCGRRPPKSAAGWHRGRGRSASTIARARRDDGVVSIAPTRLTAGNAHRPGADHTVTASIASGERPCAPTLDSLAAPATGSCASRAHPASSPSRSVSRSPRPSSPARPTRRPRKDRIPSNIGR